MRRQLIAGAAAVTATVLIAFVIPLGLAVQVLAANRPLNEAEQAARSLATIVALSTDLLTIEPALAAAQASTTSALTVYLPDGGVLGAPATRDRDIERAFAGAAFVSPVDGGQHVLVPAQTSQGTTAVVRAFVTDAALRQGVGQSWLLLAGLAVALLLVAVAVADWLGRSIVRPVRQVAATANELAAGELSARAEARGPAEVVEVAGALNLLAGRITELLAAERERVADISHRLRTPLTAVRLSAESVHDDVDRRRLLTDVDAVEATVTELIREARTPRPGTSEETVDLVDVARERADYWGALADEQGRPWSFAAQVETAPVRIRRKDAETLLDILLDNVFAHTAERTPYHLSVGPGQLVISDEGSGFSPDRAAERGASGRGSTGLGLDIVRQIAAGAGGELSLGMTPTGGARVEVRLPVAGVHPTSD